MKTLPLAFAMAAAGMIGSQATASNISINVSKSGARACYESAESRARSPGAIAQCTAALGDDRMTTDDRVATLVNRGIVLMLANRSDDAIRDFDAALALDATMPEAYLNKGVTKFRIGNSADAHALASRALELRTKKPALAYYVRGLANEERGNVRAAYADLRRAQELDPRWDEPTMQLARYSIAP